ncbi:MAG: hypothetical protein AABY01_01460 [Nanoarchaeota archaeon]
MIASTGISQSGSVRSVKGHSSGLVYAELKDLTAIQESLCLGIALGSGVNMESYPYPSASAWGMIFNGNKFTGGVGAAYGNAFAQNDIVCVALNISTGKVWFGPNGVWGGGGDPSAGTGEAFSGLAAGTYYLIGGSSSTVAESHSINAESSTFIYNIPSGFSSWGV